VSQRTCYDDFHLTIFFDDAKLEKEEKTNVAKNTFSVVKNVGHQVRYAFVKVISCMGFCMK